MPAPNLVVRGRKVALSRANKGGSFAAQRLTSIQPASIHIVGGVIVARTEDRMVQLRRTAANAAAYDLDCELISPERAQELWPPMQVADVLGAIHLPVLVVHHAKDACPLCRPADMPHLLRSLTNVPVKKLLMFDGGADPRGAACDALHWHGYIGMEKQAVDAIAAWIAAPSN